GSLNAGCQRPVSETLPGQGRTQSNQSATLAFKRRAATIGVYKASTSSFLLRYSNSSGFADTVVTFGKTGEVPIVGDWDGNGSVTIGSYDPETSLFHLRNANASGGPDVDVVFGHKGDLPVVGDWDGDG